MGNTNFKEEELSTIPNEIVVLDPEYAVPYETCFAVSIIVKTKGDIKLNIMYKEKNSLFKPLCYSKKHKVSSDGFLIDFESRKMLFRYEEHVFHRDKIYDDKNVEKLKIIKKYSKTKIYFFNCAMDREEFVEIQSDCHYSDCKIYYGKRSEGAPLIARIYLKNKNLQYYQIDNYIIDIAANVDISLILILEEYLNRMRIDTVRSEERLRHRHVVFK